MAEDFSEVPPGWDYVPGQGWVPPSGGAGGAGPGPREPLSVEPPDQGMSMVPEGQPGQVPVPPELQGRLGTSWVWKEELRPEGGGGGGGAPRPQLAPELQGQFGGRYYPQGQDYPDWLGEKLGVPRTEAGVIDWSQATPQQQATASLALAKYGESRQGPVGRMQRTAERMQVGEAERMGYAQELEQGERGIRHETQYAAGIEKMRMQDRLQKEQEFEQQRAQVLTMHRQRIDDSDRRAAAFKIDPNRLFKQQGAGATFLATLGVALAEVGRALTGGQRNVALEIVQHAIDRDVEAQKNEVWRLRDDVAAKKNMYGMMREAHQDERLAEAQTRKNLWSAFADYAEDQAGRTGDLRKDALVKEAASMMRQRADLQQLQVEGFAGDLADAEARARAQAQAQMMVERRKQEALAGGWMPISADDPRVIPGLGYAMRGDNKQIREFTDQMSTAREMDRYLAEVQNMYEKGLIRRLTPQQFAEMKQKHMFYFVPYLKEFTGKQITDRDRENVTGVFGGLEPGTLQDIPDAALKDGARLLGNVRAKINHEIETKAEVLGVQPMDFRIGPDMSKKHPEYEPYIRYGKPKEQGRVIGPSGTTTVVEPGYAGEEPAATPAEPAPVKLPPEASGYTGAGD
jgi:hypothetical protein